MRRVLCCALLPLLLLGCGQGTQELRSHGQTVSHWVEALKDPSPTQRRQAVKALGHVGTADAAALPAVTEALKDRDARVRAEAALALLNVGPAAREAIPTLEETSKDKDPTVREYARKALQRIRGE
jgi:HEAT repeat protein